MTSKFRYVLAAALVFIVATPAAAQVCTYTEQSGTTRNCIKVELNTAAGTGANAQQTQGTAANGAAPTGNPNVIAGVGPDGFVHRVATANDGTLYIYADGVVDGATRSDSVSSATSGPAISTAGFGALSFQVVSNASANTFLIEGSNDGGNTWATIATRLSGATGVTPASTGITGNTNTAGIIVPVYVTPLMHWRVSNYVGGTTTIATAMKRTSSPNVVDVNVGAGNITVLATRASLGDGSGSVATGGTSQQVFGSSATRVFLRCQNPSVALSGVAAESIFINYTTAASTTAVNSEEIVNGGSVTFDGMFVPTNAINITAATTGHKYVCKQA